jgi:hypothetical protein
LRHDQKGPQKADGAHVLRLRCALAWGGPALCHDNNEKQKINFSIPKDNMDIFFRLDGEQCVNDG